MPITTAEMKRLEDLAEQQGISKLQLMENAGKGSFDFIRHLVKGKSVLVVCGQGNNGGDGFVLFRHLIENNFDVQLLFIGDEKKMKPEAKESFGKIQRYKEHFVKDMSRKYDYIIDALLGTGTKGEVREPYRSMIENINRNGSKIVSLDVPSGLEPESIKEPETVVKAHTVLCFHDRKFGLKNYNCMVIDIGIPKGLK